MTISHHPHETSKYKDNHMVLFSDNIESIPPLPEGLDEETRKMILDPLGYDAIKDIDEIHSRNRRKTDDPYIRATSEKIAHRFPKIKDAERR